MDRSVPTQALTPNFCPVSVSAEVYPGTPPVPPTLLGCQRGGSVWTCLGQWTLCHPGLCHYPRRPRPSGPGLPRRPLVGPCFVTSVPRLSSNPPLSPSPRRPRPWTPPQTSLDPPASSPSTDNPPQTSVHTPTTPVHGHLPPQTSVQPPAVPFHGHPPRGHSPRRSRDSTQADRGRRQGSGTRMPR